MLQDIPTGLVRAMLYTSVMMIVVSISLLFLPDADVLIKAWKVPTIAFFVGVFLGHCAK